MASFLFKLLVGLAIVVGTGCVSFPIYKFSISKETKEQLMEQAKNLVQGQPPQHRAKIVIYLVRSFYKSQ